tara:strand:- start:1299 stop:2015 length:717 start_codon:yes stop_codon:yes gene_type:complete
MNQAVIEISKLSKSFQNKEVLREINLNIYESESLAIIGGSGCGKSVLTKCINGLLDYDEGEIKFNGEVLDKNLNFKKKIEHTSKFGVLFQNAALFDSLTVKENILFQNRDKKNLMKVSKNVGLNNSILNLYPSDLSVGVQKRIGLARAIYSVPSFLILDEPTTGLDPLMSDQINKLIRRLVLQNKLTTITITHDMNSVYEFADKVAFIDEGKIFWYGTVNEINKNGNKRLQNFIKGNL